MSYVNVPLFTDDEAFDTDKVNNIISNSNYLNDRKITVRFDAYGDVQNQNIKMASGTIDAISESTSYRLRWISVNGFFTPGISPICVVSLASLRNRRSTIAIAQRTGESPILDHTGFQCYARFLHDSADFSGPNYLHWIMLGY